MNPDGPHPGRFRVSAEEEAMDGFDDGETNEPEDRQRIQRRRGLGLARCVATVLAITFVLAIVSKAMPA